MSQKKCHVVLNYNSHVYWSIFSTFISLETEKNTLNLCVIYLLNGLLKVNVYVQFLVKLIGLFMWLFGWLLLQCNVRLLSQLMSLTFVDKFLTKVGVYVNKFYKKIDKIIFLASRKTASPADTRCWRQL